MTGKGADRLSVDYVNAFRIQQEKLKESLLKAQTGYDTRTDAIRRQQISQQNQDFSNVAYAPEPGVAPPAPVMRQGPSGLSLATGLMGAGVDGLSTYAKFNDGKLPFA